MTVSSDIQYFLGANAPGGFFSLYDQLLPPEQAQVIYILKGGTGLRQVHPHAEDRRLGRGGGPGN